MEGMATSGLTFPPSPLQLPEAGQGCLTKCLGAEWKNRALAKETEK